MKHLCILGASGSIGQQTLDVIRMHPDLFELTSFSVGYNIKKCEEIINEFHPQYICVELESDALLLKNKYPDINFYTGQEGLCSIATLQDIDIVLNAVVGFVGFLPTIEAIKAHKNIAIANKETLVAGGQIIMPLVKKYDVLFLPVDSEHSAIFQSIQGSKHREIEKIILTCSGGSFRDTSLEDLKYVTVKEALNHPNWSMGAKITIDSATLFNKGLEVIEAHWLFELDYDHIEVLIHPESVVHSLVQFKDKAVINQMGTPDMRLPIQYALTYPDREFLESSSLDLTKFSSLHFKKVDNTRFPALNLAYRAGKIGESMPCVLNSANEAANVAFREGKIAFLQIYQIVEETMNAHKIIHLKTIQDVLKVHQWAYEYANKRIGEINANNH